MDIVLVPGLWLDASSWDAVLPALESNGLAAHPLTLPTDPDAEIGTWVDAVVRAIDACEAPVVLVGHSGGGNVVWGAADARPDTVGRVVFVDTVPPPSGGIISEFPVVDGVVPFPGWDFFDRPDVADLDDETRRRTAPTTIAVPAAVPTSAIELRDDRRFRIPVTVLSGSLDQAGLDEAIAEWGAYAEEWRAIEDREVVMLGSGHWPQFSQPDALAAHLVRAALR